MGIGLWEILVVILLAVVLINPKDLPKIARKLGKWYKKFREVQSQVDRELKNVENEIRKPFNESEKELRGMENSLKDTVNSVKFNHPLPDLKSVMPTRSVNIAPKQQEAEENGCAENKAEQQIENKAEEDIEV